MRYIRLALLGQLVLMATCTANAAPTPKMVPIPVPIPIPVHHHHHHPVMMASASSWPEHGWQEPMFANENAPEGQGGPYFGSERGFGPDSGPSGPPSMSAGPPGYGRSSYSTGPGGRSWNYNINYGPAARSAFPIPDEPLGPKMGPKPYPRPPFPGSGPAPHEPMGPKPYDMEEKW